MSRPRSRPTARLLASAVAAVALLAPLAAAPTSAATTPAAPDGRAVMGGLVTPLSVVRTSYGVTWVSENFAGALWRKGPTAAQRRLVWRARAGRELGAVSVARGAVTFAVSGQDGSGMIWRLDRQRRLRALVNTLRFEQRTNPDAGVTYGLPGLDEECAAQWPTDELGPPSHTGIVESHPYATAVSGGTTWVADAAMNAILRIAPSGRISIAAVLPPAPFTITAGAAEALGLPACVVGLDYLFEPVPTDVEVADDGTLLVTSLPGGPEDASLGARGSVLAVDPATGDSETFASGLLTPTGLAVAPSGDVYVAELFANRVSRVPAGGGAPTEHARVPQPAAIDWAPGGLVATSRALGDEGAPPRGRVVSLAP